jgi:hypothetical protein
MSPTSSGCVRRGEDLDLAGRDVRVRFAAAVALSDEPTLRFAPLALARKCASATPIRGACAEGR